MQLKIVKQTALEPGDKWRVAVHESGHAIVAVKFRFPFQEVRVGPDDNGQVDVAFSPLDRQYNEFENDELVRWQISYAAGAAAEHVVFGEIREHGVRKDRLNHDRINQLLVGIENTFESSIEQAIEILDSEVLWSVAKPLLITSRLSVEEVHRLVGIPVPWE